MSSFPEVKAESFRFDLILPQREFYVKKETNLFWWLQFPAQLQTHQVEYGSYLESAQWKGCFLLNVSTSVLLNFEHELRMLEKLSIMPSSWRCNQHLRGRREQRETNAFIYEMGIVTGIKNNNEY